MKSIKTKIAFLALLMAVMGYSIAQLEFTSVNADAGNCCRYSSGCPGTELCRNLANTYACCDPEAPGCKGPGYCQGTGFEPEPPGEN